MVNIRLRGTVCTCGYYSARVIGTAQFSFLILTLDLASGASGRSLQNIFEVVLVSFSFYLRL